MKKLSTILPVVFVLATAACGRAETAVAESAVEAGSERGAAEERVYTGKIGVSLPVATHGYMGRVNWWAKHAVEDWKRRQPELEFILVTANSVTKQADDIEDLMVKGVDGIVVFPHDASLTSIIEKAYERGIFTVVLDRGTTKPVYDVYLSNDDHGYTTVGTEWIAKELGYKGDIVVIEGMSVPINKIRIDAIRAVVDKYPDMRILDSQPGDWNQQKSLAVMENFLTKFPRIDAVYTADDDMLKGALLAYEESGRDDIKLFLGGGASQEFLKKIIDNDPYVKANVTYPPDQIATAVSLAVLGVNDRQFEGFYQQKLPVRVVLAAELVTKENVDNYYDPSSPMR